MARKRSIPIPGFVAEALDLALDRAIVVQAPVIVGTVERLSATRPPDQVIRILERSYLAAVAAIGGAAGGTAAVPGIGTTVSLAAAAVEITAFVDATSIFVLSVAHVHGIRTPDQLYRRSLVLGALLGGSGVDMVEQVVGTRKGWGQVLAQRGSNQSLGHVNSTLTRHLMARFAATQSALILGRALPFGVGATVGILGNAALARGVIHSTRRAFGAPPRAHIW